MEETTTETTLSPEEEKKIFVTLLGDSVFDNKLYVKSRPSVIEQLRLKKPSWEFILCAVDGAVMEGVPKQITNIPANTTHLVLSIGGNDALGVLGRIGNLYNPYNVWVGVQEAQEIFQEKYGRILDRILSLNLPLIVSTLYAPKFSNLVQNMACQFGLMFINSIIIEEATKRNLPIIDLKQMFSEDHDYANPIEPGVPGADKMTNAIIQCVSGHDFRGVSLTYFCPPSAENLKVYFDSLGYPTMKYYRGDNRKNYEYFNFEDELIFVEEGQASATNLKFRNG